MLEVGCPRCPAPVVPAADPGAGWVCGTHGAVTPLRRPADSTYEAFAEHLGVSRGFPTYLPWPLGPGWSVSDFGVVGAASGDATATVTCCTGTSALDGPVDVLVVVEEVGVGLGPRVAGTAHLDPGQEVREGSPTVKVRVEGQVVPLWPVSTSRSVGEWDRSVLVGEVGGRWLWLVLRPASAVLLLRDDWILRDVADAGPHLVELPFGGPVPGW